MDVVNLTEELKIIHEDNHILVAVKPQNMPSQPDESGDPDITAYLRDYLKEKYAKEGEAYLGSIHRLDRPAGGVMVFAKTSKAAARLTEALQAGEIDKKYLAVVVGTPREKQAKLVHYLKKNAATNSVRVVPQLTEGAKYAELDYSVLSVKGALSLLKINLITGRGHQIRVQLSTIGNPICGDLRYGYRGKAETKLALWAYELRFTHPVTQERLVFRVYPPEDELPWDRFDLDAHLKLSIKNN
ncbi:MAG TPA: RluA family pseudouridine synthase [Eubacteriales bacterium]|jgi:23S rRNA pseudouridine1911/1915/1917 synthase|nr:RluA family pseudouridine synthase [Clostridia bacterium]HRR89902.1 RluA family pseudouridine synthase [Eubacteriales bacterium]HRU84244.1 RluA family pseudouridine synthase [Eubacteriales bacterium]